jgi:transcriptional regulator with XRE-family HTH domain
MIRLDDLYPTLGSRIRALREAKGLSQEELGTQIGVKKQAVCLMERGKVPISVAKLFRVAAAVGVNPATIVRMGDAVYENHPPQDGKSRESRLTEIVQQAVGGIIKILDGDASPPQARKAAASRSGGESPTLGG